jgi:hypothetical protein
VHSLSLIVSMRQPGAPMPVSVPERQRSTTFWPAAEAGRIATVVMKPLFELPVQALRPWSGFPLKSDNVPL